MRKAAVIVGLVAILTGCTASDPSAAPEETGRGSPEDMAACMRDKGWDATAHPDGRVSLSGPAGQADQLDAAREECMSDVGLDQARPPMNRAQAEEHFDALLEAAECVRELGYRVDEPPSRQAAVEALMQPIIDLDGWDPYQQPNAAARSQEEIDEVYRSCPRPERPRGPR